jgi:hypothetical protein
MEGKKGQRFELLRSDGSQYLRDQTRDGTKTRARRNYRSMRCDYRCKCSDKSREADRDPSPGIPSIPPRPPLLPIAGKHSRVSAFL